jgi:hypothetical protein
MKIVALVFGIIAFIGMFIGLIPCLGSLNWINIPFAGLGFILSIVGLTTGDSRESKGGAIVGLILCGIAILVGVARLIVGFGVL